MAEPTPPPTVAPVVIPRWIQLVLLPLAILGAWALARAAGPWLLIFVVAALIPRLLTPFVTVLRRRRVPRGLAVLLTYLSGVAVFVLAGIILADPIGDQVSALQDSLPQYLDGAE